MASNQVFYNTIQTHQHAALCIHTPCIETLQTDNQNGTVVYQREKKPDIFCKMIPFSIDPRKEMH